MGRPTDYRASHAKEAEKLCRLGATDADLADFFEVSIRTIERWRSSNKDFCRATNAGKAEADDRVERSLYQRAVGYTYDAVKIFMPAGSPAPVYAPFREHVPPDTTAQIFWLKNRRKEQWRDKIDHEHGGPNGGAIPIAAIDATKMSSAAIREVLEAVARAETTADPRANSPARS